MKSSITVLKDGPLKLESDIQVIHQSDETIDIKPVASLCRCGLSKNKPFCDGAHRAAGFNDQRLIEEETVQFYPGKNADITFNRSICSGAARCVEGLPSVFSSDNSDNWIFPDNDSLAKIKAAVAQCPSGALSLRVKGQLVTSGESTTQKVTIVPNGPLIVEGIELVDRPATTDGNPAQYALCRCGLSKNKPYCDYSHAEEGWRDDTDA